MLRLNKVLKSRNIWKQKASIRAEALREARKTKRRHLYMIARLKAENNQLKQTLEQKKNNET